MVRVTQFMPPNGIERECFPTDIPERCETAYIDMMGAGGRITAEVLTTGEVSLCIEHPVHGDFACELVMPGPDIHHAIVRMLDGLDVDRFRDFARGITEEETARAREIVEEHEREKRDG